MIKENHTNLIPAFNFSEGEKYTWVIEMRLIFCHMRALKLIYSPTYLYNTINLLLLNISCKKETFKYFL